MSRYMREAFQSSSYLGGRTSVHFHSQFAGALQGDPQARACGRHSVEISVMVLDSEMNSAKGSLDLLQGLNRSVKVVSSCVSS